MNPPKLQSKILLSIFTITSFIAGTDLTNNRRAALIWSMNTSHLECNSVITASAASITYEELEPSFYTITNATISQVQPPNNWCTMTIYYNPFN